MQALEKQVLCICVGDIIECGYQISPLIDEFYSFEKCLYFYHQGKWLAINHIHPCLIRVLTQNVQSKHLHSARITRQSIFK